MSKYTFHRKSVYRGRGGKTISDCQDANKALGRNWTGHSCNLALAVLLQHVWYKIRHRLGDSCKRKAILSAINNFWWKKRYSDPNQLKTWSNTAFSLANFAGEKNQTNCLYSNLSQLYTFLSVNKCSRITRIAHLYYDTKANKRTASFGPRLWNLQKQGKINRGFAWIKTAGLSIHGLRWSSVNQPGLHECVHS